MSFQELRLESLACLVRSEANAILARLRHRGAAADQFDRAVESLKCNVHEARGQTTPQKKIYFYGIARGSADEARACVSSFTASKDVTDKTAYRMVGLLITAAKMITSLADVIEREGTTKPSAATSEAP